MQPSVPSAHAFRRVPPSGASGVLTHPPKSARRMESATRQTKSSGCDPASPLTATHHDSGAAWVVKLVGEADLTTRATLESALNQALSMNPEVVVLDVSGLTFCDSACVSAVLDANHGGRLVLAGQSGIVDRVFQLLDPAQTIVRQE